MSERPPAPLLSSLSYALDGALRSLLTQRNLKIHWLAGTAVMIVGMALALPLGARLALLICVLAVLILEVVNTALEALVDLTSPGFHPLAQIAKDAAAGAVLLAAGGAVLVLIEVLSHRWDLVAAAPAAIQRSLLLGLPLLGAEAALLWLPRGRLLLSCGALALTLAAALAAASVDAGAGLATLLFVLGAGLSRLHEPRLHNQTPPKP